MNKAHKHNREVELLDTHSAWFEYIQSNRKF